MLALLLAVPPTPPPPTLTTPTMPTEEPPASPLAPMLAAVRELEVACRAAEAAVGGVAAVAGANSPQQVVLSGHAATIERAAALYRAAAAAAAAAAASVSARVPGLPAVRRAVRLPVGAPFHCAVMAPAAEALRRSGFARDGEGDGASDAGADADGAAVRALAAPRAPLVSGVDAAPHAQPSELRGLLADGLTRTVRFAEGVVAARGLQGGAAARFLELGPGGALAALVRQTLGEGGGGSGGGGGGGNVFSVGTTAELRAYVRALEAEERAGATWRA
jgi:[acyl-carrier-protein] S-malonyltransferase